MSIGGTCQIYVSLKGRLPPGWQQEDFPKEIITPPLYGKLNIGSPNVSSFAESVQPTLTL